MSIVGEKNEFLHFYCVVHSEFVRQDKGGHKCNGKLKKKTQKEKGQAFY